MEFHHEPRTDAVEALRSSDQDAPIVCLDLFDYREQALYVEGDPESAPMQRASAARWPASATQRQPSSWPDTEDARSSEPR